MGFLERFGFTKHAAPHFTYSQFANYWQEPDVLHSVIMDYYKRDGRFKMAIDTKRDFSVGNGFYLTGDESKPRGRQVLKLIQDFCQIVNMDELNSNIARDMWATGNCFVHLNLKDKFDEYSMRIVPIETIHQIMVDAEGKPEFYVQQITQRKNIPVKDIEHFKLNVIGTEQFGEGMGQIAVRIGAGYTTINGKKLKRPSYFAIQEMITDSMSKVFWAGLPRWFVSAKGVPEEGKEALNNLIKNMNPLQHILASDEVNISQMSLDTQNRHGDFIRHMENMMTIVFQDPISKLWADQSFTYASAQEAMDVLLPSIDLYKRQHARFLEMNIFKQLVVKAFDEKTWEEFPVFVKWGREEDPSIEDLKPLAELISTVPGLADVIDMRSLAEHIQTLGVDIKLKEVKKTLTQSLKEPPTPDDKMADALNKVAEKL